MCIKVTKLTNERSLRKANSFTTGKESNMTLAKAYKLGHSPIRTQWFEIELTDIPLFVASQLVRQTQGVQWYQRSKRTDRGGADFSDVCDFMARNVRTIGSTPEEDFAWLSAQIRTIPEQFDRLAPTDLFCQINAEGLINMARKRLCTKASKETRDIVEHIKALVEECDPDLAQHMVRPCVACGLCRENGCSYMATENYRVERRLYKSIFKPKV